MNRRNFMQNQVVGVLDAVARIPEATPPAKKMISIQVGVVSFRDEGVERLLDTFQSDAGINMLFVATFTYGRGIAGRQAPEQPLPIMTSANTTPILSTAAATRKFIRSL
jgi:hypothetical protein